MVQILSIESQKFSTTFILNNLGVVWSAHYDNDITFLTNLKIYLISIRTYVTFNQELQDMNSRRHTDNFTPSQKSPIPLNRYDDFFDDLLPSIKPRESSPEPRLVAKALYNFVGQSLRELTFKKGDIIYVKRQVDRNWYEGEHNAMIGLFPANYVEVSLLHIVY